MLLVNPVAGTFMFTVLQIHLLHFPCLELSIPESSVSRNVAAVGRESKEKKPGATRPCREEPSACAQDLLGGEAFSVQRPGASGRLSESVVLALNFEGRMHI